MHVATRVLACPDEDDVLNRAREDPTTKKTPWPRGSPRCSARALPGRAYQSIEDMLHPDMCHAVSRQLLFQTPHSSTNPLRFLTTGSQEASFPK